MTGCSSKACTQYHGFYIAKKPEVLKLHVDTHKSKLLHSIEMLKDLQPNLYPDDQVVVKEVIQYLQEAVDDKSCLTSVKQMKVKIKVLERILDDYNSRIKEYWKFSKQEETDD